MRGRKIANKDHCLFNLSVCALVAHSFQDGALKIWVGLRIDKKAFFSNQCKEIEENNRTGKTRDLFKKIRDTKGTFHAKMGSKKDRNGMDIAIGHDKSWLEPSRSKTPEGSTSSRA